MTTLLPDDVGYILHHFRSPNFGGNGFLTLVSGSLGMVMTERVHAVSMSEIPRMVVRDAFILLGGRLVGIIQGMSEAGEDLPDDLLRSCASISERLDETEQNVGLTDPSRSAWRRVADKARQQAARGVWSLAQVQAMQQGVLAAHRAIMEILTGLEGHLRRMDVPQDQARQVAEAALAVLAYGEQAPDIANFPRHRRPGSPSARTNMAGAVAFATGFESHPARTSLPVLMRNAATRFRRITAKAMAAEDPAFLDTAEGRRASGSPAAELDKSAAQY